MKYDEFLRAIRSAAEATGQDTVYVVGSQAILASFLHNDLPPEATASAELDARPFDDDENETLTTRIDVLLGEFSEFDQKHGFYVQGVGRNTAVLADGWEDRLIRVTQPGSTAVALCLEAVDLCVSKLVAMREKDVAFVEALMHVGFVTADDLTERIGGLADGQQQEDGPIVDENYRDRLRSWVTGAELRRTWG